MSHMVRLLLLLAGCPLVAAVAPTVASQNGGKHTALLRSKAKLAMPSFYHSSQQLDEELFALAQNPSACPSACLKVETLKESGFAPKLTLVTASRKTKDCGAALLSNVKPHKFFLLFGEHARELVSPESALHLARSLCGLVPGTKALAGEALAGSQFQFVANANPLSRMKVETGEFCLRVNPNGVDLNRNWNEHWQPPDPLWQVPDTNPGTKPFSEAETRLLKGAVGKFSPTSFLTVHSGTLGMYMPFAFDTQIPQISPSCKGVTGSCAAAKDPQLMLSVLEQLDKEHCQCPFGSAGKEVGYACPGTSLDFVYMQQGVRFSFAFEIYTAPALRQKLRDRWSKQQVLLQTSTSVGSASEQEYTLKSLVDVAMRSNDQASCFALFNPSTKEELDNTLLNWSEVYLKMAVKLAKLA